MQAEPKSIVKSLFGRENLMDVSKDEIRKLAEEFPYSPVIQYLLTRRLKISSDAGYGDSVARTAVYFNNPHWLSQLLRRQTTEERVQELEESLGLTEVAPTQTEPLEARLQEEVVEEVDTDVSAEVMPMEEGSTDSGIAPDAEVMEEPIAEHQETLSTTIDEEPTETEESPEAELTVEEGAGYLQKREEELPGEETEVPETGGEKDWTGPEEADNDDDASSVPTHAIEEEPKPEELAVAEHQTVTEETPSMEAQEEPMSERQGEVQAEESTTVAAFPVETEITAESDASQSPSPETPLPEETPTVAEALGETEEVIPLQPMYTMDYFASQGVSLEDEPSMRTDAKARAFTGWLRTMKPLHPVVDSDVPAAADTTDRQLSDPEAEEDKMEILTETMAEVYAKQGLRLKAIDVYRKLSLLHPDKSSIFAAKIDQLKGISS